MYKILVPVFIFYIRSQTSQPIFILYIKLILYIILIHINRGDLLKSSGDLCLIEKRININILSLIFINIKYVTNLLIFIVFKRALLNCQIYHIYIVGEKK